MMQKARVSQQGKRLQVSHESPHRLSSSKIYPFRSSRGADIILSAYSDGLRIVWIRGPALHDGPSAQRSADNDYAYAADEAAKAISVRAQSGQSGKPLITQEILPEDADLDSDDEDDQDRSSTNDGRDTIEPDTKEQESQSQVIQELNLSFGSPVLRLALPTFAPSSSQQVAPLSPRFLRQRVVVVVACADGSVTLLTLPLSPPSSATIRKSRLAAQLCTLVPASNRQGGVLDVALSWTMKDSTESADVDMDSDPDAQLQDEKLDLLVALTTSSISPELQFYRIPVNVDPFSGPVLPADAQSFHTVSLPNTAHRISFNTAQLSVHKNSQILITDKKGSLRIYDPLGVPQNRDASKHSAEDASGSWLVAFDTTFSATKDASRHAGLVERRKILDAAWICGGRSVLVLLANGEWGVWDISGGAPKSHVQSRRTLSDFAIRGSIADSHGADAAASSDAKGRAISKLAPMTPNTRKVRQESLFSAPAVTSSGPPRGGICAVSVIGPQGALDDSVALWYGQEAFYIPSFASLWQRSVSSSGRDIGSLYGPGLSRVDMDLSNEVLNGGELFPTSTNSEGGINPKQRKMLVTGEYRLSVLTNTQPEGVDKSLFTRDNGSPLAVSSQQLLKRGELDLGGVDRMLDTMMDTGRPNGFGLGKKVGFAW